MKTKNNHLKPIIVVLVLVFLVTAALLLLGLWERSVGGFVRKDTDDTLRYKGKEYVQKKGVETFLVLGLDKFDGQTSADSHENGVQTDFLMLFVFNNETEECTAVQINRDTMTQINKLGIGGVKTDTVTRQIALAYNYVADDNDRVRCGNAKDAVEDLLHGIKIDHYLSLTMDAVTAMNDFVGGVEVQVLDDFTGIDDTLIKGEKVTLRGEQALRYVRSRKGLEDSSNEARMARQQQYLKAMHSKVVSQMNADGEFAVRLVDAIDEYVVYDSSNQKMQKLAEKFDTYKFLGLTDIAGETKLGEEFVEFYPNEDALWEMVINLFYTPKEES